MRSLQPLLSHPKYRPDIDGLRAIAVLSVVFFHAFPSWIQGGFVGVDIFFVISGYLISTIIFENLDRGTFSFHEFYARRIKRIFPTLLLVLVSSYALGKFLLLIDEQKQLDKHIAAGASFVSNIALWHETSYFDNSAESKPLLHLWSLGIEEQFYIVWPLILWFAWRQKLNPMIVTIAVASISLYLNVDGISKDTVATFYSPQTRFWELLCGSLLAWFTIQKNKMILSNNKFSKFHTEATLNLFSIFGTLLLGYGIFGINKNFLFPGWWAIVPVAGTMLIILSGPKAWINHKILSNKLAIWFGLISFPLYLWHWPLLSFSSIINSGTPDRFIRITSVLLAVLLAWLTYRFLERPIRAKKNSTLTPAILTILMCSVGVISFYSFKSITPSNEDIRAASLVNQLGMIIPPASPEQVTLCRTKFPERQSLTPQGRDDNFCFLSRNSVPNVLMVGDSLNLSLFPGLSKDKIINPLVLSASSAAPLFNIRTTDFNDSIRFFNYKLTNHALDYAINNDEIKVVIMSFMGGPDLVDPESSYKIVNVLNQDEKNARLVFSEALTLTLSKLLSKGKRVIYVLPNPYLTYDIRRCLSAYRPFSFLQVQALCAQPADEYLERGGREYRNWVSSVLDNFPEVMVFDAATPFCDKDHCWGMKDGRLLYRDSAHLSIDGSDLVAPLLISLVREALEVSHR